MPKLAHHLAEMGIGVSAETLRQTLIAAGLSHQRTRSWKWSPDPEFAEKAERVLRLYRQCPPGGAVVCFDEMGPIQLIPHKGSGWAPVKRPERLRATYSKHGGVRYLFGAYDVTCRPLARLAQTPQKRPRGSRVLPPDPDALPPEHPDLSGR